MQYTFINAQHEKLYTDARKMLDDELTRQKADYERLSADWERLPHYIRSEKEHWLREHFAACRKPYEKLLTDAVALCPGFTVLVPANTCLTVPE